MHTKRGWAASPPQAAIAGQGEQPGSPSPAPQEHLPVPPASTASCSRAPGGNVQHFRPQGVRQGGAGTPLERGCFSGKVLPHPPGSQLLTKSVFYSMHQSHRKVVNIHSMKNAHGKDILHLRERSELILYAAERLFSNHKLVNLNFLSGKI